MQSKCTTSPLCLNKQGNLGTENASYRNTEGMIQTEANDIGLEFHTDVVHICTFMYSFMDVNIQTYSRVPLPYSKAMYKTGRFSLDPVCLCILPFCILLYQCKVQSLFLDLLSCFPSFYSATNESSHLKEASATKVFQPRFDDKHYSHHSFIVPGLCSLGISG